MMARLRRTPNPTSRHLRSRSVLSQPDVNEAGATRMGPAPVSPRHGCCEALTVTPAAKAWKEILISVRGAPGAARSGPP